MNEHLVKRIIAEVRPYTVVPDEGLAATINLTVETLDALPASHVLLWRGPDAIHIRCPHLTPIWLSTARCRAFPTDLGDTLDAMGLYGDFYVPTVADDMTVLTLDDTRDHPAERVSFEVFREGMRPFAGCAAQFRSSCVIPTWPAADAYLPEYVIEQRFLELAQRLEIP